MTTTCGVYFYNSSNGKILIGHVTNTNHAFSIPKGLFDEDDKDYFQAACRELLEETNIDISKLNIIHKSELDFVSYQNQPKRLKPFLICVNDCEGLDIKCLSTFTNDKGIEQPEIDWFKWVTLTEAEEFLPVSQVAVLPNIKTIINNINLITYE